MGIIIFIIAKEIVSYFSYMIWGTENQIQEY